MRLFRIADCRHPVWDGTGAFLGGGRWNSPGRAVIFVSTSYACALLEVLVHSGIGRVPQTDGVVVADVPEEVAVHRLELTDLPADWAAPDSAAARTLGDAWLDGLSSAVLLVPSAVAAFDWNALVNPLHPDAARIQVSPPVPVAWNARLFNC